LSDRTMVLRMGVGRPRKANGMLWVPCLRLRKHVGPSKEQGYASVAMAPGVWAGRGIS
jgi:hypothetical protein